MADGLATSAAMQRDPDDEDQPLDIRGIVAAVLRHVWVAVLVAAIAGSSAFLYYRDKPLMYMSTAIIEIEDQKNVQLSSVTSDGEDLKNPDEVETIIKSFSHRSLMERVCDTLDLTNDSRFLGPEVGLPADRSSVVEMLLNLSDAKLQRGSRLVDVTFVHHDPIVAQNIVTVLVEQFRNQATEQRMKSLERQNEIWSEKKNLLEKKLKESERQRQQYNETAGSLSVEDEHNIADENLRKLNSEWGVVRSEIVQMQANSDLIKNAGKNPEVLMTIPTIVQDPEVVKAKERLTEMESQVAVLVQRYREKYPALIEARAQLASAREALTRTIVEAPARLDAKFKTAEAKSIILEAAVAKQAKALLDVDNRTIRFRELQREYESDQTLFHAALQREKESYAALNTNFARFNLVEPAVPAKPLRNRRILVILGGGLGGAAFVAVIVIGRFLLATSIRTEDEAERVLGLPVLAVIPLMPKKGRNGIAGMQKTGDAVAEGFRTLRTVLAFPGKNQTPPRVIFFASAVDGEGKSFSAVQTAIAFARQGLRTLVIDSDLRCPVIHSLLLGQEASAPGVSDYLLRQPSKVCPTEIANLWALPAGTPTDVPTELLSNPRFAKMIGAMKEGFDRVIVDTAPINVVSDTLSAVAFAEAICLVVRCNSTSRKVVFRAIELLRRASVRPTGIVLNGIPQSRIFSSYYHYSSEYVSSRHSLTSRRKERERPIPVPQASAPAHSPSPRPLAESSKSEGP